MLVANLHLLNFSDIPFHILLFLNVENCDMPTLTRLLQTVKLHPAHAAHHIKDLRSLTQFWRSK